MILVENQILPALVKFCRIGASFASRAFCITNVQFKDPFLTEVPIPRGTPNLVYKKNKQLLRLN